MEHRVKQRSKEWHELRQKVPLTASQFADAVGVGKGKPFHFFKSLVEKNSTTPSYDDVSSTEKEYMLHGEKMEIVIKEAYELLTGLQIQETGFWVPEEGKPMHGLIGASPDGIVVKGTDLSKVLGLVEFKAPVHKLYNKVAGAQAHGIPRYYMVQMQGQMAVCGAPWCDFMAVCTKTRDIMLQRVFFQPRYWEHIASRLKQFCFALQEVEMMKEIGRDVFSGIMTQRLKQQDMQDKPFPAEDVITVENLLTVATKGVFRGPSHKLLTYDILVGDNYALPFTLKPYGDYLLSRVDAEIERKPPQLRKGKSLIIAREEEGTVCQRMFCEMELRSPESPERVLMEAADLFDTESHSAHGDDGVIASSAGVAGDCGVQTSSSVATGDQSTAISHSTSHSNGAVSVSTKSHTPVTAGKTVTVSAPSVSQQSSQSATSQSRETTGVTAPTRKLARLPAFSRKPPAGQSPVPTAKVRRLDGAQQANTSGSGPSHPEHHAGASAVRPQKPATVRPMGRNAVAVRGRTAPVAAVRATGSASSSPAESITTGNTDPGRSAPPAVTASAAGTVQASSSSSRETPSTASTSFAAKLRARSAKDEWEISARGTTPADTAQRQLHRPATTKTFTKPVATTVSVQSSQAQGPLATATSQTAQTTASSSHSTPSGSETLVSGSGTSRAGRSSSFDSNFVPPGLTLITGESDASDTGGQDSVAASAISTLPAQTRTRTLSGGSGPSQPIDISASSPHQGHKRPSFSGSQAEVEAKRPLLETPPAGRSDSSSVVPAQRDQGARTHISPDRPAMHRPWQSPREEGSFLSRARDVSLERREPVRDRTFFDRPTDLPSHSAEEGPPSWTRRDAEGSHHRGQSFEERAGSRIPSLLDRVGVGGAGGGRMFDSERTEDYHHRRGHPHTQGPPLAASSLDSYRRSVPLDLSVSERRMPSEREALVGGRGVVDNTAWRSQLIQRQLQQQAMWQRGLPVRSEVGMGLRNPAVSLVYPMEQGLRQQAQMQARMLDLHNPVGRDLRLRGAGENLRGHAPGQFPRGFPQDRRHF